MESSSYHGYKVPSSTYTNSFIEKSWSHRHDLERLELLGLYCTVIVNLNSVIESFISDTLKYMIGMASFHTDYSSQKHENRMLSTTLNINKSFKNKLENATYSNLRELTNIVSGKQYKEIFEELADDYKAINDLRNIIAHGRKFEMQFEGPKVSYDSTQLAGVINQLIHKKILLNKNDRNFETILNDDVILYFHNCGKEILDRYWSITENTADNFTASKRKLMPRLPNLT